MFESWKVGELECWKVGKVESLQRWKVRSTKVGKLQIGKVKSRKLESVCHFSSSPRKSVSCRYFLVNIGKCRRMGMGVSKLLYRPVRRLPTKAVPVSATVSNVFGKPKGHGSRIATFVYGPTVPHIDCGS